MAVTTEQFEAMTPIPYSQARDGLRTGDILLFHARNFPDDAIELATHSLWCHAGFIWRLPDVDRLLLLESVDKFGVRAMPLSTRINGDAAHPKPYPGQLLVLRHADFPGEPDNEKIKAMTGFALDRLGYPYSPAELAAIAARIVAGVAGLTLPGRLDPKNGYICSEYVAKCYEALGISLAPDREGFIAPADIANDPGMTAVYSLVPDSPAVAAAEEDEARRTPEPEHAEADAGAHAEPEPIQGEAAHEAEPHPEPAHAEAPPVAMRESSPPTIKPEPRGMSLGNRLLLLSAIALAAAAAFVLGH